MLSRERVDSNRFARQLFYPLPDRYDRLAHWLSLGQNGRWRSAMVAAALRSSPALVCDVASGTAGVALEIARRSEARVVGLDLTEAMIRTGQRNVARAGEERRVHLVLGRGEELPFEDATFDALCFTYLLRYVTDPAATIEEMARTVKPGGTIANLEFYVPPNPFWHSMWWLYTRLVLPAAGWVLGGRAWFEVGKFLGPSISGHYERLPLEEIVLAWRAAGIEDVRTEIMSLGGGLVMWGRRSSG